jgi:hypothetical protein
MLYIVMGALVGLLVGLVWLWVYLDARRLD